MPLFCVNDILARSLGFISEMIQICFFLFILVISPVIFSVPPIPEKIFSSAVDTI
jgi:hypothetical protein